MKRTIFGLGVLITLTAFAGCGANTQEPAINTGEITGGETVTKQEINDVQQKLQEVKAEVLKVQMDKSLSKEEKAKRIETLQAQLQEYANTKKK